MRVQWNQADAAARKGICSDGTRVLYAPVVGPGELV